MIYPKDRNIHRPPHFYEDDSYYFIIAKTLEGFKYFNTDNKKEGLLKIIKKSLNKFNFTCQSWVILDNHYQLVIKVKKSRELPLFIKEIHSLSATFINRIDKQLGRRIWYQYWDKCLRDKSDIWKHINDNHHNPIKHGYVKRMEDYKFSSYQNYFKQFGQEFLDNCFERYPIIDFTISKDID